MWLIFACWMLCVIAYYVIDIRDDLRAIRKLLESKK